MAGPRRLARSPRPPAPRDARAAPRERRFARRRARVSRLGNEYRPVRPVADGPPVLFDPGTVVVSRLEVPARWSAVACLLEHVHLGRRLDALDLQPEAREPAFHQLELSGRAPLVQDRQRFRGVEVGLQRLRGRLPATGRALLGWVIDAGDEVRPLSARGGHRLVGVVERLPPMTGEEEDEQRLAAPAVERLPQADDVPDRLRHLLPAEAKQAVVRPDVREPVPEGTRLRELVLVVREDEVEPAAVDLELRPEVLLGHHRALDVPAGPAATPRRVPPRVLGGLVRLPERKVARILLARVRLLLLHLIGVLSRKPA